MDVAWIGASVVIGTLGGYDLATRTCPNWLSLPLLSVGIVMYGAAGLWPVVIVGGLLMLAQFPAGDVKGAAAMAAWVPGWVMLPGLIVTLIVTLILMETRWYNLYQWAHRWPWLAGLGLSLTISFACGTLLVK